MDTFHTLEGPIYDSLMFFFSITPQNKILPKIISPVFNAILTEDIDTQGVITKN